MFKEVTLQPPAWKIKSLVFLGAAIALHALWLIASDIKYWPSVLLFGAFAGLCGYNAAKLVGNSISIRKFGIEIKKRSAEPTYVSWSEIERIGATACRPAASDSASGTRCIGIRLTEKSPQRHNENSEKNRLNSDYDILLPNIYEISLEKTVALLNEKMREATGRGGEPSIFVETANEKNEPIRQPDQQPDSFGGSPCFECKCPSCMTTQIFYLEEPG